MYTHTLPYVCVYHYAIQGCYAVHTTTMYTTMLQQLLITIITLTILGTPLLRVHTMLTTIKDTLQGTDDTMPITPELVELLSDTPIPTLLGDGISIPELNALAAMYRQTRPTVGVYENPYDGGSFCVYEVNSL